MKNIIIVLALISTSVYGQKIVNAYEATYEYAHVNNIPHPSDYITRDVEIQQEYVLGYSNNCNENQSYRATPVGVGRGQAQVLQLQPSSEYVDTEYYVNTQSRERRKRRRRNDVYIPSRSTKLFVSYIIRYSPPAKTKFTLKY